MAIIEDLHVNQLRSGSDTVVTFGTAAPTAGTHKQGDVVINTAPSAGAPLFWTCSVAGTPGTWIATLATATTLVESGTATLVAGTATVATTNVAAGSIILLTSQVDGGTPGFLRVSTRTAGTSFVITSSSGTDTSTVGYFMYA